MHFMGGEGSQMTLDKRTNKIPITAAINKRLVMLYLYMLIRFRLSIC